MKRMHVEKYIWAAAAALFCVLASAGAVIYAKTRETVQADAFAALILALAAVYLAYVFAAILWIDQGRMQSNDNGRTGTRLLLSAIILSGLAARIYAGLSIAGYPTDMTCWTSWSQTAVNGGLFNVYENSTFLDYPPGYLYILYLLGLLGNKIGLEIFPPACNLLLKTPSIIADMAMVFVFFRIGSRKINSQTGLVAAMLYAANPLIILDSAAWGQIDAILVLAVAGYLFALYKNRITMASVIFAIGLLIKPQMLFFGPVLAVVFIKYVVRNGIIKGAKVFFTGFISAAAVFAAVVMPFALGKEPLWILGKYMGAIESYNYITLNSANIYGMLGLNWVPTEAIRLGIPLSVWGMMGLSFAVIVYFIMAFLNKRNSDIFILTAFLMTGIYVLGLKMHERYIVPVIAILLIAYIHDNRSSLMSLFGIISAAAFVNVAQVLAVVHIPPGDLLFRIASGTIAAGYIAMLAICIKSTIDSRKALPDGISDGETRPEHV
ncbi:MAG: glycosyltransferase family 39 protein [Clostridia bacterium]|nr:glycosyltransferase family 39 protein [Clostridia bacterium]